MVVQQDLAVMLNTTSNRRNSKEVEAEKGIPLAPSEKDRTPWYSVREGERGRGVEGDKEREKLKQKGCVLGFSYSVSIPSHQHGISSSYIDCATWHESPDTTHSHTSPANSHNATPPRPPPHPHDVPCARPPFLPAGQKWQSV